MKFTSFAIITGALVFGLVGCSEKKTEADAAAPAVASNAEAAAPTKEAAAPDAKAGETAPVTAPATDNKPAPSQPPKDNPKRGTAPDGPGAEKPDIRPQDPANTKKDSPQPMVAPGKGSERFGDSKSQGKAAPAKPGPSANAQATAEPVENTKPTMKPLVNWKAPTASGNAKPFAGTWSMHIGPKMAELNAKLKKMGKAAPKFEFKVTPNGTFNFTQGARITTGVVVASAKGVKLMPTAINGKKPQFEPEAKPYEFTLKDGALMYMLNGRPGTKFVRN